MEENIKKTSKDQIMKEESTGDQNMTEGSSGDQNMTEGSSGDQNMTEGSSGNQNMTEGSSEDQNITVNSIKCDECEKIFASSEEVEFHAVKSGHASFSESTEQKKRLTEEEKKLKLKDLEDKMRQRRIEKEEEERKEVLEREKKRIQMSKNISETKRKMAEKEMMKIAEERRREKIEDKLARQRVKEQIERDKLDRKQKFAPSAPSTPYNDPAPLPVTEESTKPKECDTCKLQMRLPAGGALVQEFKAKESLSCVRLWIGLNRKDRPNDLNSITLSTIYPRKVFTEEDMDKPLNVLGLTPSSVLVVNDL